MGNKPSQDDQVRLLEEEEIKPVFEELKLVLIGSHDVGKNSIGNAIFRKKIFTYWKVRKHVDIKETRTVSGRRIHLTRTPGWKEDLNRPQKTRSEIVHCVQSLYNTEPHAVLLALKVNLVLSESTISSLENFLTVHLWDHTIVLFTHGEKLDGYSIEDYIRRQRLQSLIDKCGQRYFVIQKNNRKQITETIEDLIIRKNSACCFKPNDQIKDDKLLSYLKDLVKRIKRKIDSTQNNDCSNESKNAEIKRLKSIVCEKEREIERLESIISSTQDPALIVLQRRVAELEEQLHMESKERMEKDTEIKELRKENKMLRKKARDRRTHEGHTGYRNKLGQDVTTLKDEHPEIPLYNLSSNGSALRNWRDTLFQILKDLSNDELKEMKYYMCYNDKHRIPKSSLEDKDRVDLAEQILKQWGDRLSVLKTRDLMKKIPRNDDVMMELFTPVLEEIGETW
ncbi:hypothetical protein R3I94_001113 [Phoxinus phoxinus]